MKGLMKNSIKIKLYQYLMLLANKIQQLPRKIIPPVFYLLNVSSVFWQSRALYVATKLQIADALGDSEASIEVLAKRLNLQTDALYRLLRLLASLGIFQEVSPRIFRNSPASQYLRADKAHSMRAMILLHHSPEMIKAWFDSLETSIRCGTVPFAKANGMELFEYMYQHTEFNQLFSQAMASVEALTGSELLTDFNWGAFQRLIDVGGGTGQKTLTILKAYPQLTAMVVDNSTVIEQVYTQAPLPQALDQRIRFQASDILEHIPPAQSHHDIFTFFAVFHSLSDEASRKVLANLKQACGEYKAWVLIADGVAEELNLNSTVASFDMQMLIGTQGKERTLMEWQALLQNSGFQLIEVFNTKSFAKFILLRRI